MQRKWSVHFRPAARGSGLIGQQPLARRSSSKGMRLGDQTKLKLKENSISLITQKPRISNFDNLSLSIN